MAADGRRVTSVPSSVATTQNWDGVEFDDGVVGPIQSISDLYEATT